MEIKIFIAACMALFVVIGHFIFGIKWYLKPMLDSNLELIPKATIQSVFHYVSVFIVFSSILLLLVGIGKVNYSENILLVKFIGANYLTFSIVQIYYSFKNKVAKPLISMFQWTLFLPIGILCLI